MVKLVFLPMAAFLLAATVGQSSAEELKTDVYSGYFVSNKFEPEAAASFVVLSDQNDFDRVFGAAFVMGDRSHRLPDGAFESLTVIAAIKRSNAMWEYKLEGASLKDGVVQLRYSAVEGKPGTASFACPLIVSIPKGKYAAVEFIENGKQAKRIELKTE